MEEKEIKVENNGVEHVMKVTKYYDVEEKQKDIKSIISKTAKYIGWGIIILLIITAFSDLLGVFGSPSVLVIFVFITIAQWFIAMLLPVIIRFVVIKKQVNPWAAIILTLINLILMVIVYVGVAYIFSMETSDIRVPPLQIIATFIILRYKGKSLKEEQIKDTIIKNDIHNNISSRDKTSLKEEINNIILKKQKAIKTVKVFFIIFFVITLFGFAFYWYEWRPANIRKECSSSFVRKSFDGKDWEYNQCLREHGL